MSTTKPKTTRQESIDPYQQAFARYQKERAALATGALARVTINIAELFAKVQATLPRVDALRDDLVDRRLVDAHTVDNLGGYAFACVQANSVWSSEVNPHQARALKGRAVEARSTLLTDAKALAKRGLIDPDRLAAVGHVHRGYAMLATDLLNLSTLLLSSWPAISGKTALRLDELEAARTLATSLAAAAGQRTLTPEAVAKAADDRVRAYTLLVDAYRNTREAVLFLRRDDGDGDDLMPSLFAGRGGHHKHKPSPAPTPVPSPAPTPSPAPALGGQPTPPVTSGQPTPPLAGGQSAA